MGDLREERFYDGLCHVAVDPILVGRLRTEIEPFFLFLREGGIWPYVATNERPGGKSEANRFDENERQEATVRDGLSAVGGEQVGGILTVPLGLDHRWPTVDIRSPDLWLPDLGREASCLVVGPDDACPKSELRERRLRYHFNRALSYGLLRSAGRIAHLHMRGEPHMRVVRRVDTLAWRNLKNSLLGLSRSAVNGRKEEFEARARYVRSFAFGLPLAESTAHSGRWYVLRT